MSQSTWPDDTLPPEGQYSTREALLSAIQEWAKPRGYAFTTSRSTKTANGRTSVIYACDRRLSPPSPTSTKERTRNTTTRGTGCKFSITAKESLTGDWHLRYRPGQEFSIHNHQPSSSPAAHPAHRPSSSPAPHPAHRQLLPADAQTISTLSNAVIAPKEIRTYMRQNTRSLATQQDIFAASKREICEGQSSIQALANQLDKEGFWSRTQYAPDGQVTAVIFAHPDSILYLHSYPDTLILDYTYKTNKFGMPLLDMIGVDACQRSFCIAFAFLSGEGEEDFSWALERLKSLYTISNTRLPSVILTDCCIACMNAVGSWFLSSELLLCLWHANKAVF